MAEGRIPLDIEAVQMAGRCLTQVGRKMAGLVCDSTRIVLQRDTGSDGMHSPRGLCMFPLFLVAEWPAHQVKHPDQMEACRVKATAQQTARAISPGQGATANQANS